MGLASGGKDGTIRLWDCWDRICLKELCSTGLKQLYSLDFSADGDFLVSSGEASVVQVWSVKRHLSEADSIFSSDSCSAVLKAHKLSVFSCSFGTDQLQELDSTHSVVTVSHDQTARVWKLHFDSSQLH